MSLAPVRRPNPYSRLPIPQSRASNPQSRVPSSNRFPLPVITVRQSGTTFIATVVNAPFNKPRAKEMEQRGGGYCSRLRGLGETEREAVQRARALYQEVVSRL